VFIEEDFLKEVKANHLEKEIVDPASIVIQKARQTDLNYKKSGAKGSIRRRSRQIKQRTTGL